MSRWPGGIIRKTPVTPSGPYQCSTAPGVWSLADALYWQKQGNWPTQGKVVPLGQQAYTTAGTYSWVAPCGVTSVSVVAVGGGGGGASSCCNYGGAGGGGGALAYANNITVVPGQSYSVVVGAAGCAGKRGPGVPLTAGKDGGFSSFNCTSVKAGGGVAGGINACRATKGCGGTVINGTGGNGGLGGRVLGGSGSTYGGGGGGGAGGYTGAGGAGRMLTDCNARAGSAGAACSGAGGGGGSGGVALIGGCFYYTGGSGGGGVGIKGKGSTGSGGAGRTGGGGGSCGAAGTSASLCFGGQPGGAYGGGGGGSYTLNAGKGGVGAVRIIWPGTTRQFPSTCTGDK